jgi:hypothetical protein
MPIGTLSPPREISQMVFIIEYPLGRASQPEEVVVEVRKLLAITGKRRLPDRIQSA